MTYRFKLNETLAAGATRIGVEQIDMAQSRLASRDEIATAVHNARRSLKRLRALLRLIRPALPETIYRREANRLSGIGKLLASARDQHVMQQTLAKIEAGFEGVAKSVSAKLAKLLANGAGPRGSRASAQERRQALDGLQQARKFFAGIERRSITFDHLAAGVERSYRRARRAFREAYADPSDEAFHEWRKTVQQHWRHMQLISRAWPDVLGARAGEAKELSRLLGDDHDISVLLMFAQGRGKAVLDADELAALEKVGRAIQADLRGLAKPRGARLFAESASDLRERMVLYWSAAHELFEQTPSKADAEKPPGVKRGANRKAAAGPTAAVQAASRGSPPRRAGR